MATIGWSQERTDEVLVPVIRDMNRREAEGTQSNITKFFEGGVGVGSVGNARERGAGSKRMVAAVGRLKGRKSGLNVEDMQSVEVRAAEWAKKERKAVEKGSRKEKGQGKGKMTPATAAEAEVPAQEDAETDDEGAGMDDDDEDETQAEKNKRKAKGKTGPAKKRKTKD